MRLSYLARRKLHARQPTQPSLATHCATLTLRTRQCGQIMSLGSFFFKRDVVARLHARHITFPFCRPRGTNHCEDASFISPQRGHVQFFGMRRNLCWCLYSASDILFIGIHNSCTRLNFSKMRVLRAASSRLLEVRIRSRPFFR